MSPLSVRVCLSVVDKSVLENGDERLIRGSREAADYVRPQKDAN